MVRDAYKCCPYKYIFMDYNMPFMDGPTASRKINEFMSNKIDNNKINIQK